MRFVVPLIAVSCLSAFGGENKYTLPAVPEGLEATLIRAVPDVVDVDSVAVSADGRKVYIGEHHSACDNGKWGDILLAYDADSDGKYERLTKFADECFGTEGMLCVDDTLFLVHSPLLTAFRDLDGDGVAEEKKVLVEGLGPEYRGGIHDHTCSGLAIGTDGWLYISVGDKGAHTCKGIDGRTVQLYGGGIIRVRQDGTDMEVFCLGLRNTMDVAIDPELNVFMRDNTNDGGGWNVRSTHIWQTGQYGYPNLYKNYVEEILPCMADHGGGSPCGCIFYCETGLREQDRGKLLFCDWGRAVLYQYDLERKGATYEMKQNDWIKVQPPFRAIDVQADALGNLYVADWGRGGWGKGQASGAVIKINAVGFKPTVTVPDLKKLSIDGLVELLASQSQTLRILVQKELVARGDGAEAALLKVMASGEKTPRMQRIFALWTYKQIAKAKATPALLKLAENAAFREHALRAITDRKGELEGVPYEPFAMALKDADPFVRAQAAVCLGRLGTNRQCVSTGAENYAGPSPAPKGAAVPNAKAIAVALCEALGDSELQVRHVAMRALRAMEAYEACLQTAENGSDLASQFALIALREIYQDAAADGLIALYSRVQTPQRKSEVLKTIGRLARKEDNWANNWWGTQPNTVGPFQKFANWSSTDKLVAAVKATLADKNEDSVIAAMWALSCMRDESAADELLKLIDGESAKLKTAAMSTLISTRPPAAVPAFARFVLDQKMPEAERKTALDALSRIKNAAADVAITGCIPKLDEEFKDKKYEKNSGLLPQARKALQNVKANEAAAPVKALVMNAALPIETRTAAAQSLTNMRNKAADEALAALMNDPDTELASLALMNLNPKGSIKPEKVREFLKKEDPKLKAAAITGLGRLKDAGAIEQIALHLKFPAYQVAAVRALKEIGPDAPELTISDTVERIINLVEAGEFDSAKLEQDALACARAWAASSKLSGETRERLQKRIGFSGGVINAWKVMGPFAHPSDKAFETVYDIEKVPPEDLAKTQIKFGNRTLEWQSIATTDGDGTIEFNRIFSADSPGAAFAYCEVTAEKETKATFLFGSDDSLSVWVNGVQVWSKDYHRGLTPEQDKFPVTLKSGKNLILAKVCNHSGGWSLSGKIDGLAPPKRQSKRAAQRESLIADTLARTGDAAKGHALFNDEKRAGCIRCHKVNGAGGDIGPDLSSIGATKEKRYLIDSVLDPSKEMAQGFQPMKVTLNSGKVMFGVILNETAESFDLATADARRESVKIAEVKDKAPVTQSVMPEGLADGLTRDEFVDLVTFLLSLKK